MLRSLKGKFVLLFLVLVLLISGAGIFVVNTISKQKADGVVINLAGKQRMLSQKITKEALGVISHTEKTETLTKTAALFDKTLSGLISGNEEMGLPRTTDGDTLIQLGIVEGLWKDFNHNVSTIVDLADHRNNSIEYISNTNVDFLKEMNATVVAMEKAGLSPKHINLAGRQRMLIQKMAKEALLFSQGNLPRSTIDGTVDLFDKTHDALLSGSSDLGLSRVTDKGIIDRLEGISARWTRFRVNIYIVINESVELNSAITYLQDNNIDLLKNMNKAVGLYEGLSREKVEQLKTTQVVVISLMAVVLFLSWIFIVGPLIRLLSAIGSDLGDSSSQVNSAATSLSDSSQHIAHGASEQAASLEETSASLEEITGTVKMNADNAETANQLSLVAKGTAEIRKPFIL